MRGCDFGAKCTRNCLAALAGPSVGAHSAVPDSLAEFRGGERWQRNTAGQREGERVRKGKKGGWEGREGWGRERRKQIGMLNDNRKFDYRIKCSFSFSFVSHLILDLHRTSYSAHRVNVPSVVVAVAMVGEEEKRH